MLNFSHNPSEISAPLFSPESVFWRVNREWLTALAGPRALLLELAHPLVAAGVVGHSHFRRDPLGRLYRTLRAMTDVTFGKPAQAYETARHIHACHRRVTGTLAKEVGPYLAGTPYRANDPLLKLWVLATLIDSSLRTYDLLVAPLSLADRRAYYDDSQCLARLLGIPPDLTPPAYEDFCNY
ncbi:MAG TPA: oxygenase MpaB family protein, partial [Anaerolineales bacterium]|nr:oxygenase MpaB family protein [Anaerolineales bacterium]